MRAKHGVYFVTGNHEYYSGVEEWCAHIENLGLTVLRNKHVSLTIGGNAIDIAGVDDWSSADHDLTTALTQRDTAKP